MVKKAVFWMIATISVLALFLVSCSPQQKIVPLKKDTPAIPSGEEGGGGEDMGVGEGKNRELLSPEEKEGRKGAIHIVLIKDFKLAPREISIQSGDTVAWQNEDEWKPDGMVHQLIGQLKEFKTEKFYKGQSVEVTFPEPGIFHYFDVLYKERDLMRGTVIVNR